MSTLDMRDKVELDMTRRNRILAAGITTYRDTGQTKAYATWNDGATTSGDPDSAHMKALLDRARREGIDVTGEHTSAVALERDVQDCIAQSRPLSPAVGSTIELGDRSYVVTRAGRHGVDLRGARGGGYALIQNQNDPSLWSLIPGGRMKPRAEWYRWRGDGSFE